MIRSIDIPYPLRGLSDLLSHENQIPGTSRRALNMRSVDPRTGRVRGAQRGGVQRFADLPLGSSFVQELQAVTFDRRLTTYTLRSGGPAVEWSVSTPADTRTPDVAVTQGGDAVCLSGTDLVLKYNPEGTEVWRIKLPLTFDSERSTALAVGDDGSVFVATETGETRYSGRVFRYAPSIDDPDVMDLIWTYDASARIPDIAWSVGELVVLINTASASEVRVLNELAASSPAVKWTKPVPNPCSQVAVDSAGDIFVCSPPNADRGEVVEAPLCGTKTVDWTPFDVSDPVGRLRAWLDASQVVAQDNELVDFVLDRTGNLRNGNKGEPGAGGDLGPIEFPGTQGVRFVENAICGMPGLRMFSQQDSEGRWPGLVSGPGIDRWIPDSNTPYIAAMVIASRAIENGHPRGVILQAIGQPFLSLAQSGDPRLISLSLDAPTGLYNEDGNPGPENDVERTTANGQVSAYTDNEQNYAILLWALDPVDGTAAGDRLGSFYMVNGSIANEFGGSNFRVDQFTARKIAETGINVLGTTPWASNQPANIDLCEFVVIEGEYDWPYNFQVPAGETLSGVPWASSSDPAYDPGMSDIDKVFGYLAHRYGLQSLLPADHPFKSTPPVSSSSSTSSGGSSSETLEKLRSKDGILVKLGATNGALRWVATGAGIGFSVAVDSDGGVYSVGPVDDTAGTQESGAPALTTTIRKIIDQGFEYSIDVIDGAWSLSEAAMTLSEIRIAVDGEKNLYVPVFDSGGSTSIRKIGFAGMEEWTFDVPDSHRGLAVAIDTLATNFGDESIGEPEFIYLGTDTETTGSGEDTLYKLRLVDAVVGVGAPRETRLVGVCEGDVVRVTRDGSPSVETVVNGDGALSDASRVVASFVMNQKVYFIDGARYGVYDPATDEFGDWTATSAGTLPKRARLATRWRGRAVLGRVEGEPQNLYFSQLGNAEGWDLFPAVPTATQAFSLAGSRIGEVPDQVNALVPISDDLMLVGCDHTIWMLSGDPADDGSIFEVSDATGMAFGRPWCRDENGTLYFFGSRGGVFRMLAAPGARPEKISEGIDRRLDGFDFNIFTARLVWNDLARGLHVLVVPIDVVDGTPGTTTGGTTTGGTTTGGTTTGGTTTGGSTNPPGTTTSPPNNTGDFTDPVGGPRDLAEAGMPQHHWFWERDTQAWDEDFFPTLGFDPTAAVVVDGDEPDDRRVLIGCADGFVREWTRDAANDDDQAIQSSVLIGPIAPRSDHREGRFFNFQATLDPDGSGAVMTLYRGDLAQTLGDPVGSTTLLAGRNPGWRKRVKGQAVWVELSNETVDEWFAFESLAADFVGAGRVRVD